MDWMSTLFHIFRLPILVFVVNVILEKGGIYVVLPWIDMPMHFAGGASIGLAGIHFLAFLRTQGLVKELPFLLHTLFLVSFVGLAASLWELWEFALDTVFGKHLPADLFDTMADIFFGLLGGAITSVAWYVLGKARSHR